MLLTNKKHYNILCNNNIFCMNKVLYDFGKFGHIPKVLCKKYNNKIIVWKDYYKILYDIGDPSTDNNKAIQVASEKGQTEIVRLLLNDRRTDPLVDGNYAIKWATIKGHTEIVKLLSADNRDNPLADGNNWLIRWASQYGHVKVIIGS